MTTLAYTSNDSLTMLRRNLLHARRYPAMVFSIIIMPILLLLIFNYFFGHALNAGVGDGHGGEYINYLAPGMLLMIPAWMVASTAVGVATDLTKGIVNRLRTLAISQTSILTGHVVGSLIQAMLGVGCMVGVAFAVGFRPNADAVEWLAVLGLLALLSFALIWLAVGFGASASTPESASNAPTPLIMLPFLGSGFVPTDSMPTGVRQFAEYQPFTPITETVRGLLMGSHIGNNGVIAVAWCVGLAVLGYLWARSSFRRRAAA
ncbi:ABC transporter permease [Nocardia sp. NPDC049220]|uniref:ABC transporter permease n=1 Tax=Nocardia sp. NPDC049220 TaxID=3155273 RepID=UPI0033EF0E0F